MTEKNGVIKYSEEVAASNEKKCAKKQVQFTEEERFEIGKFSTVNGVANAVKRFRKTYPHLNFGESTARKLRDQYNEIIKQEKAITNKMSRLKHGRPVMLGAALDQ